MLLPYMNVAANIFNNAEPFEQTNNSPTTDGPMQNSVKNSQAVSKKNTFTDYAILYMYSQRG